jgi:hypothetical protein
MALVVGGEHDRAAQAVEVLEAFDLDPGECPAERKDPGWQAGIADPGERPAAVPRREDDGPLVRRRPWRGAGARRARRRRRGSGAFGIAGTAVAGRAFARQARQIADGASLGERGFVEGRLRVLLDRHQQLDPLQRAEAEGLERRVRPDVPAAGGEALHGAEHTLDTTIAGAGRRRRRVAVDPALHLAPFQLARPVGARQLDAGPA